MAQVTIIVKPERFGVRHFWFVAIDWTPDRKERQERLARIGR